MYPVQPQVGSREVRPSRGWFILTGLLVVAGIVCGLGFGILRFLAIDDTVEDFQRVDVPGSGVLDLEGSGDYSIYLEFDGAGDEDVPRPAAGVSLVDPEGRPVGLDGPGTALSYDFSGHEGERIHTFDSDEEGRHRILVEGSAGTTLAVGEGIGSDIFVAVAGGFVIAIVGVVSGGAVAAIVGVKRFSHRRLLERELWARLRPPPSWPPPPG